MSTRPASIGAWLSMMFVLGIFAACFALFAETALAANAGLFHG